ncbi:MAG: hypothetical protein V2A66_02745 [Pseudomonadota bacterium]
MPQTMISFFFNRASRMVLIMEAAGIPLFAAGVVRLLARGPGTLSAALAAFAIFEYAFIRFCASRRWYSGVPRCSGIELQFKKALVPTSYILALAGAWLLILPSLTPLAISAALLALIAHVNVILIWFHRKDRDTEPVNFFSGGNGKRDS